MSGTVFVEEAPDVLNPDDLLKRLNTAGCGAVVSFVGLTRETEGDEEVSVSYTHLTLPTSSWV